MLNMVLSVGVPPSTLLNVGIRWLLGAATNSIGLVVNMVGVMFAVPLFWMGLCCWIVCDFEKIV